MHFASHFQPHTLHLLVCLSHVLQSFYHFLPSFGSDISHQFMSGVSVSAVPNIAIESCDIVSGCP
ncbi:hypothetical protein M758_UG184200 [Ceratodon purpureus]|nr:hypothetical protein M758_UG184200 [Ceratodon purpureus]